MIIKRASAATYVLCVPKICASHAASAPRAPSHPSPLPVGSVWASFTQMAVAAKQRLYQSLLMASPRQPLRVRVQGGECPYATACDMEECTPEPILL